MYTFTLNSTLRYLKNLIWFRVREIFQPIFLQRKGDVCLLFLKAFSWVTLGDFALKKKKWEGKICIYLKIDLVETKFFNFATCELLKQMRNHVKLFPGSGEPLKEYLAILATFFYHMSVEHTRRKLTSKVIFFSWTWFSIFDLCIVFYISIHRSKVYCVVCNSLIFVNLEWKWSHFTAKQFQPYSFVVFVNIKASYI